MRIYRRIFEIFGIFNENEDEGEELSWEEAFDTILDNVRQKREQNDPDAREDALDLVMLIPTKPPEKLEQNQPLPAENWPLYLYWFMALLSFILGFMLPGFM